MVRNTEIGLVAVPKRQQEAREPDLNQRIRYGKRLGKLLRVFEDLNIIILDGDGSISYVRGIEVERV